MMAPQPQSLIVVQQPVFQAIHQAIPGFWRSGICGCFNNIFSTCCFGYFVPSVVLAQMMERTKIAKYVLALPLAFILYSVWEIPSLIFMFLRILDSDGCTERVEVSSSDLCEWYWRVY